MSENLFEQRVRIANQAIAHEEPERIPIWINYGSTPHILNEDPESRGGLSTRAPLGAALFTVNSLPFTSCPR